MFRAKAETVVTSVSRRRHAMVVTTASPPTRTGSSAATRLPKAHRRMSRTSGAATNSATYTPWELSLSTSDRRAVSPEAETVSGPRALALRATASALAARTVCSSPRKRTVTRAQCLSRVRRSASRSGQ
ncbi:hypothetical protein GCM10020000_00420 [Streptomyces olivoverticillatus]